MLVFAGPQPVTKLAELEQVSAPAITKMVSALESAGLAQREHSETDRRVVLVSATPAGKPWSRPSSQVRAIAALLADATEAQLQTLRAASDVSGPAHAGPLVNALFHRLAVQDESVPVCARGWHGVERFAGCAVKRPLAC